MGALIIFGGTPVALFYIYNFLMFFLKKKFLHENNIYKFDIKDMITKSVTDFYKIKPFPNYKPDDNKATLLNKGDKNYLASNFKKFLGFKKKVLEVGCGTGQLSIYFSIGTNNEIVWIRSHNRVIKSRIQFFNRKQYSKCKIC